MPSKRIDTKADSVPRSYPGLIQQAQIRDLKGPVIEEYYYFTFDSAVISKKIVVVPKNSFISKLLIRVVNSFDGSETILRVGLAGAEGALFQQAINVTKVWESMAANNSSGKFAQILTDDTDVFLNVQELGSRVSRTGKGWGLLQWVNIGNVRGYDASSSS